jgi:hypothetical protein
MVESPGLPGTGAEKASAKEIPLTGGSGTAACVARHMYLVMGSQWGFGMAGPLPLPGVSKGPPR